VGYLFGSARLYSTFLFSSIAINTTLCFALLCVGILFARQARQARSRSQ
jgi:hypothetical protein